MIRTSQSHPLQIAAIDIPGKSGRLGVTFCPGKVQADAATGSWRRDLEADLDAIAAWGAAVVITLVEPHELDERGLPQLGAGVRRRHMQWLHLPTADYSVPGDDFERAWASAGPRLQEILDAGFSVLVHCKGGLGRAGTIAARVLVEGGSSPADAIGLVRSRRPGVIETVEQRSYVENLVGVDRGPNRPDQSDSPRRDHAVGALVGLAVGDAVGTTNEFKTRGGFPLIADMVGGGPFNLAPGQWTDDTAMALALADSLGKNAALDPLDAMTRFVSWWKDGVYSCTGRCFDIGITTREALETFLRTGDPVSGSQDPHTAGNGSLMRLAPIAIRHGRNADERRRTAALQSRLTHAAPQAVEACVLFADILADAIEGMSKVDIFRARAVPLAQPIADINGGSWRAKAPEQIQTSGYVAHTLEATLWAVARTTSFEDAVLLAANLGDDADTTAAVVGQLAGAMYGVSGIPERWRKQLAWPGRIWKAAEALHHADSGERGIVA